MKATWGHFPTATQPLTNFFTSNLYETLQKDALDYLESNNHSGFSLNYIASPQNCVSTLIFEIRLGKVSNSVNLRDPCEKLFDTFFSFHLGNFVQGILQPRLKNTHKLRRV
jgi:hypothetical protein